MKQAGKTFIDGVSVSVGGAILIGVINYFTRRVLANGLDESAYGFFNSAFSVASVLITLAGGGFGYASMVLTAKYRARSKTGRASAVFWNALIVTLCAGVVASIALLLLSDVLLRDFFRFTGGGMAFVLICVFIPVSSVLSVVQATLNGLHDYIARNLIYIGQYGLWLLVVCLTVGRYGLIGVNVGLVVSGVLLLAVALPYIMRRHAITPGVSHFSCGLLKESWRFAGWMTFSSTVMLLMSNIDTLMLTSVSGLGSVAIYHIALPIVQIFMVASVIPLVFGPIATDLWHRDRGREIGRISAFVVQLVVLCGCALMVAIVPAARFVISILFGAQFVDAARPLTVLCMGVPFLIAGQFFTHVLAGIDRPHTVGRLAALSVVANVILNAILIPQYGPLGAGIATVSAYGILALLALRALNRHVQFRVLSPCNVYMVAMAVLCCVVIYAIDPAPSGLRGAVMAFLGVVVYGVLNMRTIYGLWDEGRQVLSK